MHPSLYHQTKLYHLYAVLDKVYEAYKEGTLSKEVYLETIKPIDSAIGKIEMVILQDMLAQKESFLPHIQKLKY